MRTALPMVLLAGCHATTSLDPPPIAPGARSLLLIAVAEDYQHAFAIEIPEDGSTPHFPTFHRPEEIDLFAVDFSCPLDVLGMEPGRQDFLDDPAARIELPQPNGVLTSHDGAEQTPWVPSGLDAIDPILRSIRLPAQNLCRLYGVSLAPLAMHFTVGTSTPTALIPRRNGQVIVANRDSTFFEVDADRIARPLPALTGAPHGGGFERNDGSVVLVGKDGAIVLGDPERSFEVLQTGGAEVRELFVVDGSPAGTLEVFRTGFDGGPLERWTAATGWEKLTDGGAPLGSDSVAWIESQEAIATGVVRGDNSAVRYKDGVVTPLVIRGIQRPTVVATIPDVGWVAGTENGTILRYDDGRFQVEPESDIDSYVHVIVPTQRGFFYGLTRWASWDPIAGYCVQETDSTPGIRLAPLGDRGFLAIGGLGPDWLLSSSFLFTLDRNDFEHPCLGK